MTTPYQLLSPVEFGYDKNETIRLTQSRQNQTIDDLSNHISGIANICNSIVNIFICSCWNYVTVSPNYNAIIEQYGVVTQILREPGFYTIDALGLKTHQIYVGTKFVSFTDEKMNDENGFPCYVTARFNYQIVDPIAAYYRTKNYHEFVITQVKSALQKAFATQPCDSWDAVAKAAKKLSTSFVECVGIQINRCRITAVKIDQNMQKIMYAEQEAQAFITGRKTIAKGAISTLKHTIGKLEQDTGIILTQQQKNALGLDLTYMLFQADRSNVEYIQGNPSNDQMRTLITVHQQRSNHERNQ